MASLKGGKTTAIGFFVDGHDVKLAKLSIKRGEVVIDELETATLTSKLDEVRPIEVTTETGSGGETADIFSAPEAATLEISSGEDNSSVILGLLSKYPTGKYAVSYAISEPSIYYHVFESDFGLKGKKLKLRILEELKRMRATVPSIDAIDHFLSVEKNLVCVVREDGLSLLKIFEDIKPMMNNRMPFFPLIECAETALINLARSNIGFAPEEYSVIIYIGIEFTRLVFMKGAEFLHFAPVIGEGYEAPNIQNTVYSRLLLEQDNMGIPRLSKIILAGECKKIAFDEFIRQQLADVDVQYLNTPYLDVSALPPEMQEDVSQFAIPIATAWKVLDTEHPAFYPVNLIPEAVREAQRVFKLGWHGYLLLAAVFVSTIFFPLRYIDLKKEIGEKNRTIARQEVLIAENQRIRGEIEKVQNQINQLYTAAGLYEKIIPGSDRWNRVIARLSKGVEDVKALWIRDIRLQSQGTMELSGISVERQRIPRIAALFENATLTKVSETKEIRGRTVQDFDLRVPEQPELMKSEQTKVPLNME